MSTPPFCCGVGDKLQLWKEGGGETERNPLSQVVWLGPPVEGRSASSGMMSGCSGESADESQLSCRANYSGCMSQGCQ